MTDIHTQLQKALKKKKELDSELQRLQGKLEFAKQNLEQIEDECAELGVDPSTLDEIISELTEEYETSVTQFITSIDELDNKLTQYR